MNVILDTIINVTLDLCLVYKCERYVIFTYVLMLLLFYILLMN